MGGEERRGHMSSRIAFVATKKKVHLGPLGLRGEEGKVEGNRVELTENRLIFSQFYFTLLLLFNCQKQVAFLLLSC